PLRDTLPLLPGRPTLLSFPPRPSSDLLASVRAWRGTVDAASVERFRAVMGELVAVALPVYRRRVHEDPRVFELFLAATPVRELADRKSPRLNSSHVKSSCPGSGLHTSE